MTVAWDADVGPIEVDRGALLHLRERIDAVLDERRDAYIALLQELVRIPTVSGAADRRGQQAYYAAVHDALAWVRRQADRLGLDYRDHDGIAAVVEWRGRNPHHGSVGVAAHLDVVPAGDGWSRGAFTGERDDDEVWGRGTQDDKGPVAMAFAALDVLQALGIRPDKDVLILLGTLEETDAWLDIDLLLSREAPPTVTLVPDGAFPIVVGEKGILTVAWEARFDPAPIVDGLRFIAAHAGQRHNVVPDAATLWFACEGDPEAARDRLERLPHVAEVRRVEPPPPAAEGVPCLEALVHGRAAHGAFPQDGHNAALDALEALRGLLGDHGVGAFAAFLLRHCRDLGGAGLGLDRSHVRMGGSTVNLGVVEAGPQHARAEVNVRFPLGLTVADVEKRFHEAAKREGPPLRITAGAEGRPQDPMFVSPEDHPRLIATLQAAYQAGTGRKPRLASIPGTTYAKAFPLAVAFGPQDPTAGEPVLAHQPDERVRIDRYLENIRIYALALALLACDPDGLGAPPAPGVPNA